MFFSWLIYSIVMITLGVAALMFSVRFFVVLLLFGLLIPVVSLIFALLLRGKVSATIHEENEQSGKGFRFYVRITNRSILPCTSIAVRVMVEDVLFDSAEKMRVTSSVAGRSTRRVMLNAPIHHCGQIALTLSKVAVRSPFGLFCVKAKTDTRKLTFNIHPDPVDCEVKLLLENPYAYIANEEYSATRPGDDPSELFGVRDYQPGDKQNRIHWNLTAVRDSLVVKELGLPIDTSALVMFDVYSMPREKAAELYDGLMASLYAIMRRLVRDRRIFYLAWSPKPGQAWRLRIEQEEELEIAMTQIYAAKAYDQSVSVTAAYGSSFPDERYRNIIYLTAAESEAASKGITNMQYDSNVTYFLITDDEQPVAEAMDGSGWRRRVLRTKHMNEDMKG